MKKTTLVITVIIALILAQSCTQKSHSFHFSSKEESAGLLQREDEFTNAWSTFDMIARQGDSPADKEKLLEHIASQSMEWNEKEIQTIRTMLDSIMERIDSLGISLPFPKTIKLVKTTSKEEWDAMAYTRQNYIVLNQNFLSLPEEQCYHILTHELFHVASRNDKDFRDRMYSVIGFENAGKLQVSDSLKAFFITNPDTPENYSYTDVTVEGNAHRIAMILYSTRPYTDGDLMEYLNLGFIKVDNSDNPAPVLKDGKPVIFSYQQLEGFFDQIGQNTGYILHPEEILAENFAFAVLGNEELPSPWVPEAMLSAMKE